MPVVKRHLPGAGTIGENRKSSLFPIQCDIVLLERRPFNYLKGAVSLLAVEEILVHFGHGNPPAPSSSLSCRK